MALFMDEFSEDRFEGVYCSLGSVREVQRRWYLWYTKIIVVAKTGERWVVLTNGGSVGGKYRAS